MDKKRKVLLVIRDGYGSRSPAADNAITLAKTPFTDTLARYPHCLLKTCGEAVGLPAGYMGGSEVGHLTIGSGRILYQNLERINNDIKSGSFSDNKATLAAINEAKTKGTRLHLLGLVSNAGVHAHYDHMLALLEICRKNGLPSNHVYIHVMSDGRDSPPTSSVEFIKDIQNRRANYGSFATLCGRFYAMDRDKRWEKTHKAYKLYTHAESEKGRFATIEAAISDAHAAKETDEYIEPRVIGNYDGLRTGDVLFFWNYRSDRMRQINQSFLQHEFTHFVRDHPVVSIYGMTQYYDEYAGTPAYLQQSVDHLLGDVVAEAGLAQLRITETDKFAHVTFFFNGQVDAPKRNEDRIMIQTPKDVKTHDQRPEMALPQVTQELVKQISTEKYDFIVVNFVNCDIVGHTGNLAAVVKAVEATDGALRQTIEAALAHGYTALVTADHGNAEEMTGEHQTSHTLNDVECYLVSHDASLQNISLQDGGLQDLAPTIIALLGLSKPKEMTGNNLIKA